jgi:hypothetical protein
MHSRGQKYYIKKRWILPRCKLQLVFKYRLHKILLLQPDEEERYQKMGHLNKVAEDLQSDSLDERLYNQLSQMRWLAWISGLFMLAILGTWIVGIYFLTDSPPETYDVSDILIVVSFVIILIFIFLRRKHRREAIKLQNEYIRKSYFLTIQTQEPEGTTTLEKFMDLATNIFPLLKKAKKRSGGEKDWWKKDTESMKEIKYDIATKTSDGWFLVKNFEKTITFEDVKTLYMKDDSSHVDRKKSIDRIVCIGKKYDKSFFTDDFDQKMTLLLMKTARLIDNDEKTDKFFENLIKTGKIKREQERRLDDPDRVRMDLIIESENGFSILWLG